jgi:hypothetical protein
VPGIARGRVEAPRSVARRGPHLFATFSSATRARSAPESPGLGGGSAMAFAGLPAHGGTCLGPHPIAHRIAHPRAGGRGDGRPRGNWPTASAAGTATPRCPLAGPEAATRRMGNVARLMAGAASWKKAPSAPERGGRGGNPLLLIARIAVSCQRGFSRMAPPVGQLRHFGSAPTPAALSNQAMATSPLSRLIRGIVTFSTPYGSITPPNHHQSVTLEMRAVSR